jgi:hypothetical protein
MKPGDAARVDYVPAVELQAQGDETTLYVSGSQAMQAWEQDLMHESADVLCGFGARFMEVGLGLGLSALRIASNPGTANHTVFEKHREVIELFTADHEDLPAPLDIRHADIFETLGDLEANCYDGIFFDPALPMELWRDEELWAETMPALIRTLRPGGAFIPFFSTRPLLREQFWPYFETILTLRRSYAAYADTEYTYGQSGAAFIQVFINGSPG